MRVKKSFYAGHEMVACFAAIDVVIAVGVCLHLKLVARLNEGFGEFG